MPPDWLETISFKFTELAAITTVTATNPITISYETNNEALLNAPNNGYFELDAFATFANAGLFSVHLQTGVHDPAANTSNDYVGTLNFDLSTGKTFSLADMLKPGEDSYRALQRAAIAEANYLQLKGLRDLWAPGAPSDIHAYEKDAYQPELLEEQEFVLNNDAIVLDCERYCGDGIAPVLLDRGIPLRIPFRQLRTFWNAVRPI